MSSVILQCSTEELYDYIEQQALENPVIEIDQQRGVFSAKERISSARSSYPGTKHVRKEQQEEGELTNELWDMQKSSMHDLSAYLLFQLAALGLDNHQSRISRYLANSLNEDGFLDISVEDAARHCGAELPEIFDVLEFMWQLDPAGVCAYDVRHSLCIQLERVNGDPLAKTIITNHLDAVVSDKPGSLARKLQQPTKRIKDCFELIRSLDPHPCRRFSQSSESVYIYPDVTVSTENGVISAVISEHYSPTVQISSYYLKLREESDDKALISYLDDRIQKVQYMQQCIATRHSVMQQLVELIVQHQEDFFLFGPGRLYPMTMTEAAKKIGVHESTVSRAARGKYLQCSHGTFPLSFFFPTAVKISDELSVSNDLIKAKIKELIDSEDKSHPLNDRVISDILYDRGINVARRTVAKYREALGIGSSSARSTRNK